MILNMSKITFCGVWMMFSFRNVELVQIKIMNSFFIQIKIMNHILLHFSFTNVIKASDQSLPWRQLDLEVPHASQSLPSPLCYLDPWCMAVCYRVVLPSSAFPPLYINTERIKWRETCTEVKGKKWMQILVMGSH